MALAKLSIDLEARLANFQYNLDKAGHIAEQHAAAIQADWERMQKTAESLGVAIGSAFSLGTIAAFIRNNANAVDALNDVVDATGSTVESISALEALALRTGDNLDLVSDVLVKFNGVLKDADGKNGVSQALEAIGLHAEELRQLDPAEALRQTAVALSRYADDGDKARLIQELFGKSAKEAAHFLHDLADAGQLVATTTAEEAARAEEFNKKLAQFQTNVTLSARAIVTEMLPALNDWAEKLNKVTSGKANFWDTYTTEMGSEVSSLKLQAAVSQLEDLSDALNKDPGNSALQKRVAELRAEIPGLQREAAQANEALKRLVGQDAPADYSHEGRNAPKLSLAGVTFGGAGGAGGRTGGGKAKTEKPDFVGPEIPESYVQALRALEQTDTVKIENLRLQLQYLVNLKSSGDNRLGIDEAILNLEQSIQNLDPAQKHLQDLNAAVDQLLYGKADKLAELNEQLSILQERLSSGAISEGQFDQAAKSIYGDMDQLNPQVKKQADEWTTFTDQAQRNIQNSMSGFLSKAMKGDFKSIETSFVDMLNNMVAEALAAKIGNAIFGTGGVAGAGAAGAGGSWLSSAIGWGASLFGGFSTSSGAAVANALPGDSLDNFIGVMGLGLANGGPAQAGGIHPIVERNEPEVLGIGNKSYLLMPQKAGLVTPLQPARSSGADGSGGRADVRSGGTINLTQHITTPPGTSRATQEQMATRAYAASVRAFSRHG